jgi:hypothetical protein
LDVAPSTVNAELATAYLVAGERQIATPKRRVSTGIDTGAGVLPTVPALAAANGAPAGDAPPDEEATERGKYAGWHAGNETGRSPEALVSGA